MSAIKDGGLYPIMLDKERYLLFSLDVLDEIEDEIGDISELANHMNAKGRMKFVRWLLVLTLNEGARYKAIIDTGSEKDAEILTERTVGLVVHLGNIKQVTHDIFKAFSVANNGTDEVDTPPESGDDEDDEGNGIAGEID